MKTAGIDHLGRTVSTLKRTLVRLDVWLLQSIHSSLLFDVLCLNSRLASEFWLLCLNLRLASQLWALCLNSRLVSEFWALCLNSRLASEFWACVWIRVWLAMCSIGGPNQLTSASWLLSDTWKLMLDYWDWGYYYYSEFRWNKLCELFQNIKNSLVRLMLTSTDDLQCDSLEPG